MAEQNPLDDPHTGTTREKDFGRTDRYQNKDGQNFNIRNTGDDAETPGVSRQEADPDDPSSGVNRDE
jgi:hypothetical protein